MAKSAALGFTLAGVGTVAIISGIQGKSIAEVLKGEIGEAPNPAYAGEGGSEVGGETKGLTGGVNAGIVSPFKKGTAIEWGRLDQGIDGRTPPGTPLIAMGNGTVTIAHNPSGFGSNYVVLHIENDGSFYYGHAEPLVHAGPVKQGQVIARTHVAHSWGNSTTPGGFEIGKLGPNGEYPPFATGGKSISSWFKSLPQL